MLTPFPHLLDYSYFAPTLLRIGAAITFIYIGQFFVRERMRLLEMQHIPIVGRARPWMVWFSTGAVFVVGVLLFVGLYTQWAALIGILIVLKHLYATKNYGDYIPFKRSTYLLLLIILVSLMLTGAGAIAFDLPL